MSVVEDIPEKVNYKDANLKGANLQGSNLKEANFKGAKLEKAIFVGSNLKGANFKGANLREANLQGAELQGANLKRTDLENANLLGANLEEASLEEANLKEANLQGANLIKAKLIRAKLQRANLNGANLQGADLQRANFRMTQLKDAKLKEANLEGTQNLLIDQLSSVKTLYNAKLDNELRTSLKVKYSALFDSYDESPIISGKFAMGKQELCNSFYDMNNVVTVRITMPQSDWEALRNAEPYGGTCNFAYIGERYDWFSTSSVEISGSAFPSGGAHSFASVAISKKSYCGSISSSKPALRLDFSKYLSSNEEAVEDLIGTKYITLNNCVQDPSYIRQPLGYLLFKQAGLPYSRCNFAEVYVNNTFIGVYLNIEPIKKLYIQNNFKGNDKGNLYEIEVGEDYFQSITEADRIGFDGFSKYSNKSDLKLATTEITDNGLAGMLKVIDIGQFIRFFAMETLLKDWDGYTDNLNNSYLYNDVVAVETPTVDDISFKFIPWGLDQILQKTPKIHLDHDSILGKLVHAEANNITKLKWEISNYYNTIFDRDNYNKVHVTNQPEQNKVHSPDINQMQKILSKVSLTELASEIPHELDQILGKSPKFHLDDDSIPGKLVRNDANSLAKLKMEIRNYCNTIFDRDNYNNVLSPYIDQMQKILISVGLTELAPEVEIVREQLKLVKSGGFQLVGDYPSDSVFLLDRELGDCVHASNTEFIGAAGGSHQEVCHYAPTTSPADRWYISQSDQIGTYKFKNMAHSIFLHCSTTVYTPDGNLNIDSFCCDPDEGNNFYIEPVKLTDEWQVSGYFRLRSAKTLRYVYFSEVDLTSRGRKAVNQIEDPSKATILYLF